MPPKRVQNQPAKKKAGGDPTFGMKNKKGKKAAAIQNQMQNSMSKQEMQKQAERDARKDAKIAKKEAEFENLKLFRPVAEKQKPQIVPAGVDPKSVLCLHFKKGNCQYGDQCKFSHDLNIENKAAKKDMYTDVRELEPSKDDMGNMSDWDQETLLAMVNKKAALRPSNASAKVCKYFLKAIEHKSWGWLWVCPNGGDKCPYRHALPPGFVLVDKSAPKAKVESRPLEEILEEERAKIITGTPVNPETFAAWKEKIEKQKEAEAAKAGQQRAKQLKSGERKATGREILEGNPEQFIDTEDKGEEDVDLLALLKAKNREEEELDQENARLAEELAAAVEKELKEMAAAGVELLTEAKATALASGTTATTTSTATTSTAATTEAGSAPTAVPTDEAAEEAEEKKAEVVLNEIDQSLFTGEDLPEDFSDEDK